MMRKLCVVAVGGFLTVFLVVAVNAAPVSIQDTSKQPQGIENSKKIMKHRIEQDKKKDIVRKKGQAMRKQAQSGK